MKCLDSRSDLLPTPLMGQTGVIKYTILCFCLISPFILAFRALECIKRYWETLCEESR